MKLNVDVYMLDDSQIPAVTRRVNPEEDITFNFTFYTMDDLPEKNKSNIHFILFEEKESFLYSEKIFDNIFKLYDKKTLPIIISRSKEIYNVVRWIRKGAIDYLWEGDLRYTLLTKSLVGSYNYTHQQKKIKQKEILEGYISSPVSITTNHNWNKLINDKYYPMSLVMIKIIFPNDAIGRYSKHSVENILKKFTGLINNEAENFGGKLWYWSGDFGVASFYFDDYVNSSVLMAINYLTHFFINCIDQIGLKEEFSTKIAIHTGETFYNKSNTDHITSDLINSISHLLHQNTKNNQLIITEDIYNKLSIRLSKYFMKYNNFEQREIYEFKY